MCADVFEISFTSDTYRVKQVVISLLAFIRRHFPSISQEDVNDLRLIFCELLFNATIHGNNRDSNKSVHVRVEISEETIVSIISDEGLGFDYLKLLSELGSNENLYSENGRGIRLVYSLTDSLAFNVSGNEIKFYKRVASDG